MKGAIRWLLWLAGTQGRYERATLARHLGLSRQHVYGEHQRLIDRGWLVEVKSEPLPYTASPADIQRHLDECRALDVANRRMLPNGRWTRSVQVRLTEAGKVKFREEFAGHEPK